MGGVLKFSEKQLEALFLGIVFILFLWLSVGPMFDNRIIHPFPVGYLAQDSFFHEALSEYVYKEGSYTKTPEFLTEGIENIVAHQPPMLYYLVASVAYLTRVPVHDTLVLLTALTTILCCMVVYFLIKSINKHIALLALPLMVFMFSFPFNAALFWGQYLFVFGMFFMLVTIHFILSRNYLAAAATMLATVYVHTSEFLYLIPLAGGLAVIHLLKKHKSDAFMIGGAVLATVVLSSPYLFMFAKTWMGSSPAFKLNIIRETTHFNAAAVQFSHFGIVQFFIFMGIVVLLSPLMKKKIEHYFVWGFLLLIGMSNYLNQWRAFQFRFFFPLTFSLFFGVALYLPLYVLVKQKSIVYYVVSALLIVGFVAVVYEKQPLASAVFQELWDSLGYVQQAGEPGQKLLVVENPLINNDKILWRSLMITHKLPKTEMDAMVASGDLSRVFPMKRTNAPMCEQARFADAGVFRLQYSNELFTMCTNRTLFNASLCSYDYILLVLAQVPAEYGQYWQSFVDSSSFEIVKQKNGVFVLQNNGTGVC
ncbi:MAG: hypothetical protein ABIG95_06050 [Candidatus Woesearchaeota archaeon]